MEIYDRNDSFSDRAGMARVCDDFSDRQCDAITRFAHRNMFFTLLHMYG